MAIHASDCAIHNGPGMPVGPCDCGADERTVMAFRVKLSEAMVGYDMADITTVLADALGILLSAASPMVRNRLVEEVCAKIAREASTGG